MLIADIVSILGFGLCVISNVWALIVQRFINGLTVGVNSAIVPLFINEISPLSLTGRTGSMNQAFINVGIIGSNILGLFLPYEKPE